MTGLLDSHILSKKYLLEKLVNGRFQDIELCPNAFVDILPFYAHPMKYYQMDFELFRQSIKECRRNIPKVALYLGQVRL